MKLLRLCLCSALTCGLFAQTPKIQPSKPKERDLKLEREEPAPAAAARKPTIPRSYALVIGIGKYEKLPVDDQLKFPERDAESIYSVLISPEGGNFRAENVHRLIGSRANLANLRREIETWLPSVAKDDDRALIYFAGHGFVNNGKSYLAPYDIDPNNTSGTGYARDSLGAAVGRKIKGKWKVLLPASCHSGAITPATDAATLNTALKSLNPSLF